MQMASSTELSNQANEHYVGEDYQKAIELYTQALAVDKNRDDIYCHRAQANFQLGKLKEALEDCDKAIQVNGNNSKAYIKKGMVLLQMEKTEKALTTFQEGYKLFETDNSYEHWIKKCQGKIQTENKSQPDQRQPLAGPPRVRYDWYQTHTHVVVTILEKNVKKENLTVDVEEKALKVHVRDPPLLLDLILAHTVDPQQGATKIYGSKIEIKLKKKEGIQWARLEGSLEANEPEVCPAAAAPKGEPEVPRYPSSSHHARDWDKLAAEVMEEEKNEKLEGDAGLNQFFQKIYADASDETKKAMMKSFSESGGTVLSTNWDEVASKKVDVKPPDGMEFKKWEN